MKGFTLIELLVVVLIIGILASIALPQYELVVEKSRASEAMVNAKAIQDAAQRHMQEHPEHESTGITNCTQIADVQLKGGTWNQSASNTCATSSDTTFTTNNFIYKLNGTTFDVTRKGGETDDSNLYKITFFTVPNGTSRISSDNGCSSGNFAQVCRLFSNN
ncbi:MAG: prepilin-type N-terminal cleavage/methylation domain-containing protein [Elusimicrobiaceae bacterium]|nr:prepilin-type N-terminal cleavage/methylation domain-containing protein [Elusimicrobiaceae bacterium]